MKLKNYSYKYYFIYIIKNIINGHGYVGFHATNKEFNKDEYFGSGILLNNKILEYGKENFIMVKIEDIKSEEWQEKEIYWIKKMGTHVSLGHGYNLTWGGDGILGYKHTQKTKLKLKKPKSEEHKIKISKTLTGRVGTNKNKKFDKEWCNNISKSHKGLYAGEKHPMWKKHHKKESKELMRNAKLGKKQTKEHIRKRSESLKGRISPLKDKKLSKKACKKISQAIKNRLKLTCPHCNKIVDNMNFKKWHGDNCKFKK